MDTDNTGWGHEWRVGGRGAMGLPLNQHLNQQRKKKEKKRDTKCPKVDSQGKERIQQPQHVLSQWRKASSGAGRWQHIFVYLKLLGIWLKQILFFILNLYPHSIVMHVSKFNQKLLSWDKCASIASYSRGGNSLYINFLTGRMGIITMPIF